MRDEWARERFRGLRAPQVRRAQRSKLSRTRLRTATGSASVGVMLALVVRAVLSVLLVIGSPLVVATAEQWSDGIFDAEPDDLGQAITRGADTLIDIHPVLIPGPGLSAVCEVVLFHPRPRSLIVRSGSNPRSPPLSLLALL